MASKKSKSNNGKAEIDLGLKELLAAVNPQTIALEPPKVASEEDLIVETLAAENLCPYQGLFNQKKFTELEAYTLEKLAQQEDLEAKLWWIQAVYEQKKLPIFLLVAPFQEVKSKLILNDDLHNSLKDLIRALESKLFSSAEKQAVIESFNQSASDVTKATTPEKFPNPILTDEAAHLAKPKESYLKYYLLFTLLIIGTTAYLSFQPSVNESAQSILAATQISDTSSYQVEKSATQQVADSPSETNENNPINLEKSREIFARLKSSEEALVAAETSNKSDASKAKKDLGMKDILQMVNEAPEPKFEQKIKQQKAAENKNKTELEKIKTELKIGEKKQKLQVDGPLEPSFISDLIERPEPETILETAGNKIVIEAPSPNRIVSPIAPRSKAKPAIITKAGPVYTNTSLYAVEIDRLLPGDEIWILENQGAWLKIASKQGEVGFIDAKLVS